MSRAGEALNSRIALIIVLTLFLIMLWKAFRVLPQTNRDKAFQHIKDFTLVHQSAGRRDELRIKLKQKPVRAAFTK